MEPAWWATEDHRKHVCFEVRRATLPMSHGPYGYGLIITYSVAPDVALVVSGTEQLTISSL